MVVGSDGTVHASEETALSHDLSKEVFERSGKVARIVVSLNPKDLK